MHLQLHKHLMIRSVRAHHQSFVDEPLALVRDFICMNAVFVIHATGGTFTAILKDVMDDGFPAAVFACRLPSIGQIRQLLLQLLTYRSLEHAVNVHFPIL